MPGRRGVVVLDVAVRHVLSCTSVVPLKLVTPELFQISHALPILVGHLTELLLLLPGFVGLTTHLL